MVEGLLGERKDLDRATDDGRLGFDYKERSLISHTDDLKYRDIGRIMFVTNEKVINVIIGVRSEGRDISK